MSIGQRLKQFIKYKGLKQSEFSERMGFSTTILSRYVNDKHIPGPETLIDISLKFEEINLHWLLTGQGEMLLSNKEEKASNSEMEAMKEEIKKLWAAIEANK